MNKDGNTALIMGAVEGKLEVVRLLVENNAKLESCNNNGATGLLFMLNRERKREREGGSEKEFFSVSVGINKTIFSIF